MTIVFSLEPRLFARPNRIQLPGGGRATDVYIDSVLFLVRKALLIFDRDVEGHFFR